MTGGLDRAAAACGALVALAVLVRGCRPASPRARLGAALPRPPRGIRAGGPPGPRRGTLSGARWGSRPGGRRAGAAMPVEVPGPAAVAVLSEQLAGLVRAGLPAARVWRALADRSADPGVRALAAAAVAGQYRGRTTASTLRAVLGDRPGPGSAALRQLVVALDVSERTGAPLAETLLRLAEALRQDENAAQERAGALAGPRASALVLSLLPLAGLGLGGLLGGDPVHVLLGTAPGRSCLLVGSLLWFLGRVWTAALVRRAAAA